MNETSDSHRAHGRAHQARTPAGLGRGGRCAHPAELDPLVRRLRRGVRPALPRARRGRHVRELSDAKRPNSYLARSDPGDVARVEDRTFICSERGVRRRPDQQLARPRRDAGDASRALRGSMQGRTMYVVPFSMGPLGSPIAHIGVQLTDSAYVAVSMRIMTRMGKGALDVLGEDGDFVPCLHSVGYPLADGARGRAVAVRRGRTSTSSTSPRAARSGPTARATAATRCSARSASRCGSPR